MSRRDDRTRRRVVLRRAQPAALTRAKIADQVGYTPMQAWRALNQLRRQGLVDRDRRALHSRWWAARGG